MLPPVSIMGTDMEYSTSITDEIDKWVEAWHASPSYSVGRNLHDHLGITWPEYRLFAEVGAMPIHHEIFRNEKVRMLFDMERVARFAELARHAWPDDEASVAINDRGEIFVTGKKYILLTHTNIDRFESALKQLAGIEAAQQTA